MPKARKAVSIDAKSPTAISRAAKAARGDQPRSAAITRRALADEMDEFDDEIAAQQNEKKAAYDRYRAQLRAGGLTNALIKQEIDAFRVASRRRRQGEDVRRAHEVLDHCVEEILAEISASVGTVNATRARTRARETAAANADAVALASDLAEAVPQTLRRGRDKETAPAGSIGAASDLCEALPQTSSGAKPGEATEVPADTGKALTPRAVSRPLRDAEPVTEDDSPTAAVDDASVVAVKEREEVL